MKSRVTLRDEINNKVFKTILIPVQCWIEKRFIKCVTSSLSCTIISYFQCSNVHLPGGIITSDVLK